MRKSILFFALLLSLSIFQSCEKESFDNGNPDNLVAPTLPTTDLYSIPTAALRDDEADNIANSAPPGVTYKNWIHAGLNLLVWNTVVVSQVTLPIAAFAEAFNHQAEFIGNATFEWAYQYTAPGANIYNISLTGQYISNTQEVDWVMTASKVGGFSDIIWYTGSTNQGNTQGTFTLNRNSNNPEPYLELAYTRNNSNNDGVVRYTNVAPNDPGNGNYIEYRTESSNTFNRAFDLDLGSGNFLEIQWNEPSGEGRVKHENHFNDTEWHCWNVDKVDVDC